MARDRTSPASLQTDPQHRGLLLFKGKLYLWLANAPQPHLSKPIHNTGVETVFQTP